MLKSLLALVFGLTMSLILAEVLVANFAVIDTPPGLFQASPTRAFEHRPNFNGRDRFRNPIRINSMGFRDREYSPAKPEGVYRILVLGDSVTFGDGLPAEDTFVKQLEQKLNAENLDRTYEVLNAGVRGYNTFQEVRLLKETGFKYDPDLVILAYVLNDAEPFSRQKGLIPQKYRWLVSVKNFVKQHSHLYAFLRRRLEVMRHRAAPGEFAESYTDQFSVNNPGWLASAEALRELRDPAPKRGYALLVAVIPKLEGLKEGETYPFQSIHEQVLSEARSLDMDTLDLLPYFKGMNPESVKIVSNDTFHPNRAGNELIARALAEAVQKLYPPGRQ